MRLFLLKKKMTDPHGSLKISEPSPSTLLRAQKLKTYPFSAPYLPPPSPPPLLFYQSLNILKCKRSSVNIHDIFVKIFTCLRFLSPSTRINLHLSRLINIVPDS